MRTVASLVASATATSTAAVGLTLASTAREELAPSPAVPRARGQDMTEVATYTRTHFDPRINGLNPAVHRSFSTPHTTRFPRAEGHESKSAESRNGEKGSSTRRDSIGSGGERGGPARVPQHEGSPSQTSTPSVRPPSWLRRFSNSMSASRDSSQTPSSRPGSAAVSQSNASTARSNTGSTTPIFGDVRPSPLPPNKLVKRSSSLRSSNGSSPRTPGSRLPLPVFKRPATSHQRSAPMQVHSSSVSRRHRTSLDLNSEALSSARDPQMRHYFTSKIAADEVTSSRRRSPSGIPNPIRRMYPDRRYTPVLMSARERIPVGPVELDDRPGSSESIATTGLDLASGAASSPLPPQTSQSDGTAASRRSFSFGDLLSTGPQQIWKRPLSSRGKSTSNKLARKNRPRVTSAPLAFMGSGFSSATNNDSERPAKRRDLTDPQVARRSVYSAYSSSHTAGSQPHDAQVGLSSSTAQPQRFSFVESPVISASSQAAPPSSLEPDGQPSATSETATARHVRVSGAQSEIAASTVGSDSERRSTGGYSTDYQSDTVYDSYPTRTTRSSSGKRGPSIDTIFDESPPLYSSSRSRRLGDLLNDGRHSTIEEEESIISTPVRSLRQNSVTSTPAPRPSAAQVFGSSPPAIILGHDESESSPPARMPDPDEIDWDAPDDDDPSNFGLGMQIPGAFAADDTENSLPLRFSNTLARNGHPTSAHSTPSRHGNAGTDKANIFDWSEVQPSPSHQQDQSPPRPRTVHGKKEPDQRGSRPPGRRAPSGMHARSHSVPVVPDVDGKRSIVANKFGTWNVGTKAVTEDWNEDFEFEEPVPPVPELPGLIQGERRVDSGAGMVVPDSIKAHQDKVLANIGLLKEWGMLIEELKALRMRAVALDMLKGPDSQAWEAVNAMIELADQESEEETLQPRLSPPSSPGFDFSAFDEEVPELRLPARPRGPSVGKIAGPPAPEDLDVLPTPHALPTQEVRNDSEALARSVITALLSKRSAPAPVGNQGDGKKVSFDAATLRCIVPYVNGLKRKVKDALRETEGLYSSPRRRQASSDDMDDREVDVDQSFRSMFDSPQPDSPTARRRSHRNQAVSDNDEPDMHSDQHSDLAGRMQRLALQSA